jgi:hypothetical protein
VTDVGSYTANRQNISQPAGIGLLQPKWNYLTLTNRPIILSKTTSAPKGSFPLNAIIFVLEVNSSLHKLHAYFIKERDKESLFVTGDYLTLLQFSPSNILQGRTDYYMKRFEALEFLYPYMCVGFTIALSCRVLNHTQGVKTQIRNTRLQTIHWMNDGYSTSQVALQGAEPQL